MRQGLRNFRLCAIIKQINARNKNMLTGGFEKLYKAFACEADPWGMREKANAAIRRMP